MIRPLLVGALLLCSTPFVMARNPEPVPTARALPMQFQWRKQGPADVCGNQCRVWISATGAITADTPHDFEVFAQDPNVRGATMVLDSEGGSVLGALALGRAIRRLGMTTTVGRTVPVTAASETDPRATLSPEAYCESMCTFVLLAGTRRYVSPESRVLVHQIWLGDRRNDAMAATYTAEDLVLVQRDIGRIAQYTIEMGGSIDLLEVALRIPPWEPMKQLSQDEVQQMHLSTVDSLFQPVAPQVVAATNAAPPATLAAVVQPKALTDRGWSLVEDAGTTLIARRHPLTLEGENIGQFDLLLGCGDNPDHYSLTYVENRSSRDATRTPSKVRDVSVSISRTMVQLNMSSSESRRPTQLSTVARGSVPASLITSLADFDSRSVSVITTSANNARTVIRIGNSGLAKSLARLAAACGKQANPTRSARAM